MLSLPFDRKMNFGQSITERRHYQVRTTITRTLQSRDRLNYFVKFYLSAYCFAPLFCIRDALNQCEKKENMTERAGPSDQSVSVAAREWPAVFYLSDFVVHEHLNVYWYFICSTDNKLCLFCWLDDGTVSCIAINISIRTYSFLAQRVVISPILLPIKIITHL